MGIAEVLGLIIPMAVKYGPAAIESVTNLIDHFKNGGELTEEEAAALRHSIAARSKRIQDS